MRCADAGAKHNGSAWARIQITQLICLFVLIFVILLSMNINAICHALIHAAAAAHIRTYTYIYNGRKSSITGAHVCVYGRIYIPFAEFSGVLNFYLLPFAI